MYGHGGCTPPGRVGDLAIGESLCGVPVLSSRYRTTVPPEDPAMRDTRPRTLPQRTRSYESVLLDGPRWDRYQPRDDDVVVATPYKSGTTWTLALVRELFALEEPMPPFREQWVDCRFRQPADAFHRELEALEHRRYLKTHLALDGLPFFPQVKYIVVGRDVRDVFMSFWNHYRAMAPNLDAHNAEANLVGAPLPPPPDDVRAAWRTWITRGWFPWESEGYPFWGNMHHVQTWWDYRHLDNILFMHFDDLKRDLDAQVKRIGAFVGVEVPDAALPGIREAVSVDAMQAQMARHDPDFAQAFFRHRGTNGRWREALTDEDLALYERKAAEVLAPDARAWLEGRAAQAE